VSQRIVELMLDFFNISLPKELFPFPSKIIFVAVLAILSAKINIFEFKCVQL
jgi:hypothetical protein